MTIGILSSTGGHLTETLQVVEAFRGHRVFLVTYDLQNVKGYSHESIDRAYYIPIYGSESKILTTFGGQYPVMILSLLLSFTRFFRIFIRERPQVLFSTGAEIAIPGFWLAKLVFGIKLIFLESCTRPTDPSMTAKLVYPITDLFLVQAKSSLKNFGRRAYYGGSLL